MARDMPDVDAHSITRPGATSFQTVVSAAESILAGTVDAHRGGPV